MAGNRLDDDLRRMQRKKTIAATASAIFLVLLVVGTIAFITTQADDEGTVATRNMHSTSKSVQMLCSSTDYPNTCVSTITRALESKYNDSSSVDPKELLYAALHVVNHEVDQIFGNSQLFKSNDSRIRDAAEDCIHLFDECRFNIERSMNKSVEFGTNWSHDLETWTSAVISFQQTCTDDFPEGETKEKVKMLMKMANEVSSNAVAIVGQVAGVLTLLGDQDSTSNERQLLENAKGSPIWLSKSERRSILGDYKSKLTPNVTVAKDGTGNFTTISAALDAMPEKYHGRYIIYVKEGIYKETVDVKKRMMNVTMYGDGSTKSIITGSKNVVDGTRLWLTATMIVSGDGFIGMDLGILNTAGPEKQEAVALRVMADKAIFLSCRMEGYQQTIYAQAYRQFYRNCIIKGTVDFVSGDAAAVFQQCIFLIRRPLPTQSTILAAQSRSDRQQTTGFVLHRCKILPDPSFHSDNSSSLNNYLGRPSKKFSRLVIMESHVGKIVHPEGYAPSELAKDGWQSSLYFAEYRNVGGGSNFSKRVKWPGFRVIGTKDAKRFTVGRFLHGSSWIQATGVPVKLGLYRRPV
ncbi:hypothetical protein LUZ63_005336 [Rhynchospora breviuscula]|uniref:Pectinesterase n=1 Tax=Rhynchospora breviuscula TaxID=2022672 RepID=A0A9Q0HSI5_9POAL|nr:hypothetical protein LUZ63_005336 [Rhynchospora breviuscula]